MARRPMILVQLNQLVAAINAWSTRRRSKDLFTGIAIVVLRLAVRFTGQPMPMRWTCSRKPSRTCSENSRASCSTSSDDDVPVYPL
jgi:hypothetical protein